MVLPSGDHAGWRSANLSLVRRRRSLPSAFTTNRSESPPSYPVNTICLPSGDHDGVDRKSTRLNSSHSQISYAVFCLKKKKNEHSAWHEQPVADMPRLLGPCAREVVVQDLRRCCSAVVARYLAGFRSRRLSETLAQLY